jgi:hypothetical protein
MGGEICAAEQQGWRRRLCVRGKLMSRAAGTARTEARAAGATEASQVNVRVAAIGVEGL